MTPTHRAVIYMLAGTLAGSTFPLLLHLAGVTQLPLMVSATWKTGSALGLSALVGLRVMRGPHNASPSTRWRLILAGAASPLALIFACAGEMDVVLFGLAVQRVDTAVATAVYQSWPAMLAAGLGLWRAPNHSPFRASHRGAWLAFGLASCGVALLAAAQARVDTMLAAGTQLLGLAIALTLAAAVAGEVFATLRAGAQARLRHGLHGAAGEALALDVALTITAVAVGLGAVGSATGGWVAGERIAIVPAIVLIVAGASMGTLIRTAVRAGNNVASRTAMINIIPYSGPALAVTWLIWAGVTDTSVTGYMGAGIVAIVAGNITAAWAARRRG